MAEKINVGLKLDDSDFLKGLQDVKGAVVALGGALVGAFAVKKAIDLTISGFKAGVEEAMKQEDAISRLNAALSNTGKFSQDVSASMQGLAAELERTTRFSGSAVLEASAMIQTLGNLDKDGLQRATRATTNLAAALKIDLVSAADLVGKAAEGNVAALKKHGLTIEDGAGKAKTFANALAEIEKKFGGRASADALTFSGRLDQLKNAFDGVLGKVGKMIIDSPVIGAILSEVGKAILQLSNWLDQFAKGGDPIRRIAQSFLDIGKVIVEDVLPPLEIFWNTTKAIGLAFATVTSGIMAAATTIASAFFDLLLKPIRLVVEGWSSLIGLFDADLGAKFQAVATGISQGVSDTLQIASQSTQDATAELANATSNSINNMFNIDATAAAGSTLQSVQQWLDSVRDGVRQPADELGASIADGVKSPLERYRDWIKSTDFGGAFVAQTKTMSKALVDLGKQVHATLSSGLSNAFASMGKALVEGENGMKAFGKAMLGVLGDIAIQFGSAFIGMGIGKSLLFDPTGPLLIAAGAALTVLGGAIKAMAGAGAGGTSPASAGAIGSSPTGSQGGGIVVDGTPDYEEPKAKERGNAVVVNVHGNIFNNRETALEIAEVLNSAWGTNAVAVGGMA